MRPTGTQPPGDPERDRLRGSARQLEALVLKQLVSATGAFTGGGGAGSAIRADLFADALADAMVRGGGIGLARQIEDSLRHDPFDGHLTRHEGVHPGQTRPVDPARALKIYELRADDVIENGS